MKISFVINNQKVNLDVDPTMRLLDVIRNELHLTGTKEGCGEGECGACTVLVNEEPINSCLCPVINAANKNIMTIEGFRETSEYRVIADAFADRGGSQCGFCTPGFILKAVEIVGANKPYTRDEIKELITGNLCRCTGYMNIVTAIEHAIKHNMDKLGIPYEVAKSRCSFDLDDKEKQKMLDDMLKFHDNDVLNK